MLGDPEEEAAEPVGDTAAEPPATPPVVPPSTGAAPGHSKVVAVIVSTLFMDAWARGGAELGEGGEIAPSLSAG